MYEAHFGFREPPFRITPDPRFLYRNPCVEEAAAALAYGIERRKGFLSLVGEAGTGKTTLLRHVIDTLSGNVRTVVLLHPTVEFDEILEYILSELGIPTDGGRKLVLLQRLNEFLIEHTRTGGNVALLIDEAQDLEGRVLEELRLLSNLETGTEKILQIVLAGQPELEAKLADPSLRQLRQRIALHVRLRPLSSDEVAAYMDTRLQLAGAPRSDIFTPEAVARIATVSQGIPRIVNVLADACLVTAYATNAAQVSMTIVDETWADYGRLVTGVAPAVTAKPAMSARPGPLPVPAPVAVATAVAPAPSLAIPIVPAPDIVPAVGSLSTREPIDGLRGDRPERSDRSPWWASAHYVPSAAVLAILAMLALNVTLRGRSPTRDATPTPETASVGMPATSGVEPRISLPSAAEARALVHQFVLTYEARDAARLADLFTPEASDNEHLGVAAIRADYERTFAHLRDVTVNVAQIAMAQRGDRIAISGPVRIAYRDAAGVAGEMRGTAEWEIASLAGIPRILRLRHDVIPPTS